MKKSVAHATTVEVESQVPGMEGFLDAALEPHWPGDPEILRQRAGTEVFKASPSTLVLGCRLGGEFLVVKRHRPRTVLRRLRTFLRPSRAIRAYRTALALRRAGIRVPRPRGVLEVRRAGFLVRSYLVSDGVEAAETLFDFLHRAPPGEPRRRVVARGLGRLLGRTEGAGFRNRDLKAPNFLVGPEDRVWLVDLDGVRRSTGPRVRERRRKDWARLLEDVRTAGPPDPAEVRQFLRGFGQGIREGSG